MLIRSFTAFFWLARIYLSERYKMITTHQFSFQWLAIVCNHDSIPQVSSSSPDSSAAACSPVVRFLCFVCTLNEYRCVALAELDRFAINCSVCVNRKEKCLSKWNYSSIQHLQGITIITTMILHVQCSHYVLELSNCLITLTIM